MDSATRKVVLDGQGHKFGGDAGENPSAQGKGSSLNSLLKPRGKGTRVLSDKASSRLETLA
jgi:hypothetical protein